jgi:hypothetical protein
MYLSDATLQTDSGEAAVHENENVDKLDVGEEARRPDVCIHRGGQEFLTVKGRSSPISPGPLAAMFRQNHPCSFALFSGFLTIKRRLLGLSNLKSDFPRHYRSWFMRSSN